MAYPKRKYRGNARSPLQILWFKAYSYKGRIASMLTTIREMEKDFPEIDDDLIKQSMNHLRFLESRMLAAYDTRKHKLKG